MQSLDSVEAPAEGTSRHPAGTTTAVRMDTVVVEGMIGRIETGGIATGIATEMVGTTEIGVTGMAVGPVVEVMGIAVVADTRLSLTVMASQYTYLRYSYRYQGLLLSEPLVALELRPCTRNSDRSRPTLMSRVCDGFRPFFPLPAPHQSSTCSVGRGFSCTNIEALNVERRVASTLWCVREIAIARWEKMVPVHDQSINFYALLIVYPQTSKEQKV